MTSLKIRFDLWILIVLSIITALLTQLIYKSQTGPFVSNNLVSADIKVEITNLAIHKDSQHWISPTGAKPLVLKKFSKPAKKWLSGHRGVDLASDSEIYAPADGTVIFSGKVVDRTVITIEHSNGLRSSFEPVIGPLPKGFIVHTGDVIASVDTQVHHCEEKCFHWGVRQKLGEEWDYINPLLMLGNEKPSILLTLGEDFGA